MLYTRDISIELIYLTFFSQFSRYNHIKTFAVMDECLCMSRFHWADFLEWCFRDNSNLLALLENNRLDGYLVGDGGYAYEMYNI